MIDYHKKKDIDSFINASVFCHYVRGLLKGDLAKKNILRYPSFHPFDQLHKILSHVPKALSFYKGAVVGFRQRRTKEEQEREGSEMREPESRHELDDN